MISKYHGRSFDIAYLREISNLAPAGTTMGGLADAAEKIGFSTLALSVSYDDLSSQIPLPCIARWRQRHYVAVYEATPEKVIVGDPAYELITYSKQDFLKGWIPLGSKFAGSISFYGFVQSFVSCAYSCRVDERNGNCCCGLNTSRSRCSRINRAASVLFLNPRSSQ